jgi:hypothetical protein
VSTFTVRSIYRAEWDIHRLGEVGLVPGGGRVLAVLKPNRIICKRIDANCNSFHLKVFLGLSNP